MFGFNKKKEAICIEAGFDGAKVIAETWARGALAMHKSASPEDIREVLIAMQNLRKFIEIEDL